MSTDYENSIDTLLKVLQSKGWYVLCKEMKQPYLNDDFRVRYPGIPEDFAYFLATVDLCSDSTGGMWFLTEPEYNRQRDRPLAWDFCERLVIDALEQDGHSEEVSSVKDFWDAWLPILLSARAEYVYLALERRSSIPSVVVT